MVVLHQNKVFMLSFNPQPMPTFLNVIFKEC